ncbi:TlpA family protein disulfide reductase [Bacillus sp. ISL-47]|uniref:peroxiredoxin family protein n=1 Tax=Bacillus sp. ISL-47 TaxID=2819130 RepID=UPI001BEA0E21|nr:TlpA disulfide reductase family protein [Bacillus sp. ISL-47]MBT2689624.1 TlpA family protein disulfide reductase [Bacillus sp. ISL-47]MBT2708443.1 TlpA family protein disulfide reductase [Pseudomonas sp. ISL-84]
MFKKMMAAVVLFVLVTTVIVQAVEKDEVKTEPVNQTGLGIGLKAPDFELKNLEGETVKLSDYVGKKVMLNFWATWCPPCKAEMPDIQKFYTEKGDEVAILAVNIDPQYDVAGFAKEMRVNFPILLDENEKAANAYQILTIPTTFFIDEKGIIRNKYLSAMPIEIMRQYTEEM